MCGRQCPGRCLGTNLGRCPAGPVVCEQEGLLGDVTFTGHLGHSDHQMTDFFQTAGLVLLVRLAERILWEAVLKEKGVQEGRTCFKKGILKVQEQAVYTFQKMSQ